MLFEKNNEMAFKPGNKEATKNAGTAKNDNKSFTRFFREQCNDPLIRKLFRDKLIEGLQSEDHKLRTYSMKIIADKMILSAEAEIVAEEAKIKAEDTQAMLAIVKARLDKLTNNVE